MSLGFSSTTYGTYLDTCIFGSVRLSGLRPLSYSSPPSASLSIILQSRGSTSKEKRNPSGSIETRDNGRNASSTVVLPHAINYAFWRKKNCSPEPLPRANGSPVQHYHTIAVSPTKTLYERTPLSPPSALLHGHDAGHLQMMSPRTILSSTERLDHAQLVRPEERLAFTSLLLPTIPITQTNFPLPKQDSSSKPASSPPPTPAAAQSPTPAPSRRSPASVPGSA
jgi:hypothetical protein